MKLSINYKAIIAAFTLSLGLLSCAKNDDNYQPVEISGLSLIHASPTTEKLDVYLDNTKGSGTDFAFGTKIDYLNAYAGNRKFTVTKKDLTTSLKTEQFTLEPRVGYSLFVVGKLENIAFLLLKDDLVKPAEGKAKVRFVNLSPDAEALSLAIVGETTDLATNKAFKEFSAFETINAAEKVTFNVKNNTSGSVETSLTDVKIENGKVYTIYVKGLKSTSDETKFGAAIFTHK
jgi:hypothetical protein